MKLKEHKYSLWNLVRNKDAVVVQAADVVCKYKEWRKKGSQYYLYQNGRLLEYNMSIKRGTNEKVAWVNVYDAHGNFVEQHSGVGYSWFADKMIKARNKFQGLFSRKKRIQRDEGKTMLAAKHEADRISHEAAIAEQLRRNMAEFMARRSEMQRVA